MRLSNEVVLPAAPDEVFALLGDVERVAPCLPGATLEGREGDDSYRGRVRVKVGPISASYRGTVRFLEVDESGNRLVLDARGSDEHGSGGAEAKVQVRVRPHDEGSLLSLDTDLVIRGKVAQFGRGALGTVSQQLMEKFARNLGGLLTEAPAESATPAESAAPVEPAARTAAPAEAPQADGGELDGISLVALPLLKRAAPVAAALATGFLAGRLLGGRARPRDVLADEVVTATVHIGTRRYAVPARRIVSLLGKR
ncbi:SRPBCC family protein [Saccharopolyspora rosea]|uniref:SRPBCC family protein n=1 Tax=Saccharopolyspora rosea TaxID=524884 RepID=UPI0021DA904C|nr:SRPBCC family protein [Saccharopolyspora rosea]